MVQLLAQNASATDVTVFIQNAFQQAIGVDVVLALRLVGLWLFIIWLVFALWVAIDASARYKQWQAAVLWFLFVLPFNLLGFVGYLFMRPAVTIDEHQWTRLESKYLMHELSSVNDCPNCGTLVPLANNYCSMCGTQMNRNCPKCDAVQSIYNLHCSNCGEKLGEPKQGVVSKREFALFTKIKHFVSGVRTKMSTKVSDVKNTLSEKKKARQAKKNAKKESTEEKKG